MQHIVNGHGPVPCDIMCVGERPSRDEVKFGYPFAGKSGKQLNADLRYYLHRDRGTVYVTNVVKTMHPSGKDVPPTEAEIERDSPDLDAEVAAVNPTFIVCLGRTAARYFLGPVDMEVVHGLPHLVGDKVVVPAYHPAAGLHNTEIQGLIAWDWRQVKLVMGGGIEPVGVMEDEYPEPQYKESSGIDTAPGEVAIDTEGSYSIPWGLSYSSHAGRGFVVKNQVQERMDSKEGSRGDTKFEGQAVPRLRGSVPVLCYGIRSRKGAETTRGGTHEKAYPNKNKGGSSKVRCGVLELSQDTNIQANAKSWENTRMIFHNSMFDLGVLRAMGIEVPDNGFDDTMIMAYLLCVEPQGLKPLCKRHCGMEMDDYADIIRVPHEAYAVDWLLKAHEWANSRLSSASGKSTKTGRRVKK